MRSFKGLINKVRLILFDADSKKKSWKHEYLAYKNAINSLAAISSQQGYSTIPKLRECNLVLKEDHPEALKLKDLLDNFGSDKSSVHNYHLLYAGILKNRVAINIFEMGLGTPHLEMISNMGPDGKPGASLRSFKEMYPNANIYGADIDKRILFNEDRIKTFYANQLDKNSLADLHLLLAPLTFDLIIDDGLHTPEASINTLEFAIDILAPGGYFVIEDIKETDLQFYLVMKQCLNDELEIDIFETQAAFICVIKKLS
ncbi:MAG: hypothetical protein ABIW38_15250 [Ferruginibacter sp.]